MSRNPLTTREVTVQTAGVEVKTLTLRGRQLTLSVFRQIRPEPLIDQSTIKLNGVPWGWVNYFWGDDSRLADTGALHVVWQRGSELLRCVVPPVLPDGAVLCELREADEARAFWADVQFALTAAERPDCLLKERDDSGRLVYRIASSSRQSDQRAGRWLLAFLDSSRRSDPSGGRRLIESIQKESRRLLGRGVEITDAAAAGADQVALQRLCDELRRHLAWARPTYRGLFADLLALPQLFIAT